MQKIVYKTETGIAIITPAHGIAGAMKDITKGAEYKIVDESELPQDRTYRNAWNYELKIDAAKKAKIDEERAKIKEKKEAPDLLESLRIRIANIENMVAALGTAKEIAK